MLVPGEQAQQINQVVPFVAVFDVPAANALRIPVVNPADGALLMMRPPPDILAELSSQIYGLLLRMIGFKNRRLYQGVPPDDGFALVRHLRTCQAEF